ncbi:MAG: hypothetical protein QW797_05590, partial [Thermoproteota archaeon]
MKWSIPLLIVCLIASASFTTVLCSDFQIVSNPSPTGAVFYNNFFWDKLPDGQVGQTYSVVFSTTGSPYPDSITWKIYGSVPGLGFTPQPGV